MSKAAKYGATAARVVLGLEFFVFGLNGFLNFMPKPDHIPDKAAAFAGALFATGYFFPLLKGTEVVAGALLLSNRFVPLALAFLAPIVINIVAFHTVLEPSGAPIALITLALEIYLAWSYRAAYRPMLASRVAPSAAADAQGARLEEARQGA
ncbi:MAG TPA: DoxX family protein [Byssovorax sp.]